MGVALVVSFLPPLPAHVDQTGITGVAEDGSAIDVADVSHGG